MTETNVYRVKFKGIDGEGFIAGKTEDEARKRCRRYSGKLISIKFDHKMKIKSKKGK